MKPQNGNMRFGHGASGGFSLVEIAVAVGLFAFGVVGVIGLFPAAIAQRADASRDTRARLIAEQVFSALRGSDNEALIKDNGNSEIVLPPLIDMGAEDGENAPAEGDLRRKQIGGYFPFCLGFGETGTTAVRDMKGDDMWKNGVSGEATDSAFIALVTREPLGTPVADEPHLYRVNVQVGYPGSLPAEKRRNVVFSSLVNMR
jgi:type II secretory pathway pseudopilin PulG